MKYSILLILNEPSFNNISKNFGKDILVLKKFELSLKLFIEIIIFINFLCIDSLSILINFIIIWFIYLHLIISLD